MSVVFYILIPLCCALLGGYFGAYFQSWFQNRKISKVRRIAIQALKVFERYAKQNQTYDMAASEFNNDLDIVEKRSVLVALCKLGIPVIKPLDSTFNIDDVKFEHKVIEKETIGLMIGQVNKGNCDDMFFSDVETYFSANTRLLAARAVAKKYVDIDLSECKCDRVAMVINHPKNMSDLFTPGEINILNVFRDRTCCQVYFDETGKSIQCKMDELKREIDLGLWDTYLFWDWISYQNVLNQNYMAATFANALKNNPPMQNSMKIEGNNVK